MFEQLAGISSKKWLGTSGHFKTTTALLNPLTTFFKSHRQAMSSVSSPSSFRWSDLTHPVVAGLIS
ncbi:MAG: hypothetical protein RSE99_06310, partial [Comamonas sp.]